MGRCFRESENGMKYEEIAIEDYENANSLVTVEASQSQLLFSIAASLISISSRLGQLQVELNEFNRMHKKI